MTYVLTFIFFATAYILAALVLSGLMHLTGLTSPGGPQWSFAALPGFSVACVAWIFWWIIHENRDGK